MTVEQIAARLQDHSVLMLGGSRTAQPRQQTLRATLDWSHALLTEPERRLLRRLSVFAGGWSLEACEAVCGEEGVQAFRRSGVREGPPEHLNARTPEHLNVDLLTSLVDKSLVAFEERDPEAGGRYRLPEIVRQ
jgi:predicted ATPase